MSDPLTRLSDEESLFAETVRQFASDVVAPRAHAMDAAGRLDPEIPPQCFELGLMGIEIPEDLGGAGASFFMACLAVEELSRADPSVGVFVDVQNTLFNNCLLRWGSEAQKREYAPRMAADTVGAYALSEATSGSDAFGLNTRAEKRSDRWVLNGSKMWITNGAEAGVYVVFATIDPAAGYKGITAFLVERDFPGFAVGKKEDKLGIRASSTTELLLEGCEVPEENVLGEPGKGYKVAIETLNEGRIGIGAQMIGCARGRSRPPSAMRGRGRPLASRSRSSRGSSSRSRRWPPSSRPRASWCTTPPGSRTRGCRSSRKRRWPSSTARKLPKG